MKFRILMLTGAAALGLSACGGEPAATVEKAAGQIEHIGDTALGRALFVQKGCVICHSVNGTGGKAAPALDAADPLVRTDPLEFSARMWRGAPAMVEFQSAELGYVIDLSADDIANLAAFASSRAEQEKFESSQIPGPMADSLLDERFWEYEDWSDFFKSGQEEFDDGEAVETDQ
ncbi:MAG: c-type cytochrome [Parvularculaceae bacterium]|nr:c-type cytochrome [Parvularculaceae bacterium]